MFLRKRRYLTRLRGLLKQFPIVCILGPRQCGKTTFVKSALPSWRYLDLERPSDSAKVSGDPEDALRRWDHRMIFDEAQRLPELFPVLRSFVDEKRGQRGRIVLLGSASFSLIKGILESLAGRVGFLDMTPFHLEEVSDWRTLWFRGGFPEAYLEKNAARRLDWFEAYTRTFLERDLNQLGIDVSSAQMRRFWAMLAHVHGNLWNASEIAGSVGFTYHTADRYLDILEQTFLARRLSPYYANIGKRIVKSPKVYLRDSGLLHYFLGIGSRDVLEDHPKKGSSWEGFVVEQIIGFVNLHLPQTEAFFFRTSTGHEVDFLLKKGPVLIPVEIKAHSSPQASDVKGLLSCMKDLGLGKGYVVRPPGEDYSIGHGVTVTSLQPFFNSLRKLK